MKSFKSVLMLSVLAAVMSCQKESGEQTVEEPAVLTGTVQTTIFSAQLSGSFGDKFTTRDLSMGKTGFVYIEKSGTSGHAIQDWCDNVKDNGCNVVTVKVSKDKTVKYTLTKLNHSTEYDYCVFYESEDGKRYIGDVLTFQTSPFKPDFGTEGEPKIDFYMMEVNFDFHMIDKNDLDCCEIGYEFLTESDSVVSSRTIKKNVLPADGKTTGVYYYLKYGIKYKARMFLQNKATGETVYSEPAIITVKDPDLMKVDLGLSVMWADRPMGLYSYRDDHMSISRRSSFYWGVVDQDVSEEYPYVNKETNEYIEIGDEISGTEYDIAHAMLGGKWRMPRKDEIDELLENSTQKYAELNASVGVSFKSKVNGKSLFVYSGAFYSSTISDELSEYTGKREPYCFGFNYYMQVITCFVEPYSRLYAGSIVPVWDPNM